ncbi:MAG: phosphate ABC transporter permease subunit PstC [Bacteroidales bacterium]|jgi:phosphate transport system permease protein|nr:phosphate ABC transporter permease subunit PstC [Bacteroidales bacterium]
MDKQENRHSRTATMSPKRNLVGRMNIKHFKENGAKIVFILAACISILAVALICIFLFANGIPGMTKIGVLKFLTGRVWKPGNNIYGIFPMILGSIYVTAGALVIGVPTGIITAVFISKFASVRIAKVMKQAVSLLAGIPSVVYGFYGLIVVVPLIRDIFGVSGTSMLSASIILGIMILPTIISISEPAFNAVPKPYYEGALALGATHERAVFRVILPAAKSGVTASVVLGVGRAIGEAMAVMMVAGNQARMPKGILQGIRTLTSNIVMEMGYAADLHREALIATAVVLFVFILIINMLFSVLKRRTRV